MTPANDEKRIEDEIVHGRLLSRGDPETIWGWGTPAGQIRAARRARLISEGAHLGPGMTVLEIGCGGGMFTEMFARSGAEIVAVDVSPDLLDKARRRGLPADRVRFIEADFEKMEWKDPFDAVIGSSVLHHLNLRRALIRIRELLKPGGCLAFAEPNLMNPQVFLERVFRFLPWFDHVSPDETAFVRWRLCAALEQAGFKDVSITPFDFLHPSTPPNAIAMVSKIGHALEKLPASREISGSLFIKGRRPRTDAPVLEAGKCVQV